MKERILNLQDNERAREDVIVGEGEWISGDEGDVGGTSGGAMPDAVGEVSSLPTGRAKGVTRVTATSTSS